ncbi:hypothetical protein L596_019491 [Steinernema carpocapsae]|uniref:Uncharacterized protein n=1 Tax=Steinernema carpocapsae TaxID=34508 RepID=A0A4U5MRI4_STECR|nr:hypothetical protein L596_019491 [Steinernema carpocapsae]
MGLYYSMLMQLADNVFKLYNNFDFGIYGFEGEALREVSFFEQPGINHLTANNDFVGVKNVIIEGGHGMVENPVYQEGLDCYRDYYRSFGTESCEAHLNGTKTCNMTYPNADLKLNEGFTNLQDIHLVTQIVKKLSKPKKTPEKRLPWTGSSLVLECSTLEI